MEPIIGIYKITNKINGKSYVGQSVNVHKRWTAEKNSAFNPNATGYDYPLSLAFRKYGLDNFSFEVIEYCDKTLLDEREVFWIRQYDTFFHGYNQTMGGDGSAAKAAQNKEIIIVIIQDLKTTDLFHKEIASKWGVSTEMVQGINTGRYWKHDTDYPLQKQHKLPVCTYISKDGTKKLIQQVRRDKFYCKHCGVEITKYSELCIVCYKATQSKNIPTKEELWETMHSLKGNFCAVARYYNVSDSAVRKWLRKYELPIHKSIYT